jgi:hypothetical protein
MGTLEANRKPMKVINLKNYHLEPFLKILNYNMSFQKGRVKKRIVSVIGDKFNAIEKDRLDLVNKFAQKDKSTGKPISEGGHYKFTDGNFEKFQKEFLKLSNEDCLIDVLPSIEKDLGEIKDMMNKSPIELDDREIAICEEVIEALNEIKTQEKKKK